MTTASAIWCGRCAGATVKVIREERATSARWEESIPYWTCQTDGCGWEVRDLRWQPEDQRDPECACDTCPDCGGEVIHM